MSTITLKKEAKTITVSAASANISVYPTTRVVNLSDSLVTATGGTVGRKLEDELAEWLRPQQFGALGAGADETTKLQAAIDAAVASGRPLYIPSTGSSYGVTAPLTISGPITIRSNGALLKNITNAAPGATRGMIEADFSSGSREYGIVIDGLQLEGSTDPTDTPTANGFKRGIVVKNASLVAIRNCKITHVDVPVKTGAGEADAYGIWLTDGNDHTDTGVTDAEVSGNYIEMKSTKDTDLNFAIGILVQSDMVDSENGQVTGAVSYDATTKRVLVSGNTVINGTHGLNPQNAADVRIIGNYCDGQAHRNLHLMATNKHIVVQGNTFKNAGSVNLIAAYWNEDVVISGNVMDTTEIKSGGVGGEGCNIQVYYGARNFVITDNLLVSARVRGIQVAYGAENVSVSDNTIIDPGEDGIGVFSTLGSGYTNVLASGGAMSGVSVCNNRIRKISALIHNGIFIIGSYPSTGLAPSDLDVRISGNEVTGGQYGIRLWKNGYAVGTWAVSLGANKLTGASVSAYVSDYDETRNDTPWGLKYLSNSSAALGTSPVTSFGLVIGPSSLTGTNQIGVIATPTASAAATVSITGLGARAQLAAGLATNTAQSLLAYNPVPGVGASFQHGRGLVVEEITGGTSDNYAIETKGASPLLIGGFVEMPENTDPAAPAANKARLYVRDSGAGKTQLVVVFPTGAVQVIATEP